MKRSFLILALFFCSSLSYSQVPGSEILKSVSAGLKKDDVFIGLITLKDGSHVIINSNATQQFTFQRYDRNLNPIRKATTTLIYGIAKTKNFKSIIQLKDKFFLSFCTEGINDYLYSQYVIEFDPYEMVFKGNMIPLFRNEQLARGSINKTDYFYYKNLQVEKTSPDSSKYLVACSIADYAGLREAKLLKEPEIVSDTEEVHFTVLDQDFKLLWKREFIFRNKIEDYAVTNNGKIYVLVKVEPAKSIYGTNYEVYIFKDSISKPEILCPNMVGKSMKDGKFFFSAGGQIRILGTFSDVYTGFYSVTIYDTLPHYGETSGDMIRVELKKNVFLREIKRTEEGKFKVIFEEYQSEGTKETFENLYVMSMNETGNIEWYATVPKLQVGLKSGSAVTSALSYKCTAIKNQLRLYYIDNEKNFGPEWKTGTDLGHVACLAEVQINPSGNVNKYKVGKVDELGNMKTQFYYIKDVMYAVNNLNHKNKLYKLKAH